MATNTLMDKLRTFFGFRQEPPRNDFRNPIWGTDDYDDGDELYTKHQMTPYDPNDVHREFSRQINEMFRSFGSIFDDMRSMFQDDHLDNFAGFADMPSEPDNYNSKSIRDYYLKPGYHSDKHEEPKDIDLDGKISSNEISGLLKQKGDKHDQNSLVPFSGDMIPGRSFCKTVITTSVTKPDGTMETRRIIKNGNEIVEETVTSTGPSDSRGPYNTSSDSLAPTGFIYSHVLSELSSLFKNFY
ncbi:uncharacterized protein LOC131852071 [Achroia grisella]|uniref:uncharacterized protein LOC131852071 n=1 Tax=Achroia grisella TaxID=688607 RepID=UPI0027D1FE35|nr:uncharacterized protein LOC131852071 [Achroia grisella]